MLCRRAVASVASGWASEEKGLADASRGGSQHSTSARIAARQLLPLLLGGLALSASGLASAAGPTLTFANVGGSVGSATNDSTSGTYTVSGRGWTSGAVVNLGLDYTQLTGNFTITARVTSMNANGAQSNLVQGGLVALNGLSSSDVFSMTDLQPGTNQDWSCYRTTAGSNPPCVAVTANPSLPRWNRITRVGNVFTEYDSADGTTWTQIGQNTVALNSTVYVGLWATNESTTVSSSFTFDNVSITGAAGSALVSVTGVTCSTFVGTSQNCSGTATITASGGPVTLNAVPVTLSGANATDFTVGTGTCASASLTSGQSCNLGTITFNPAAAGSRSVILTSSVSLGNPGTATLTGTASAVGTAVVAGFSNCTGGVGVASTCTNNVTVTASGGAIQFGATIATLSGAQASDFALAYTASGACSANQLLASGNSCVIGPITFTAGAAGTRTANVTVTPVMGAAGSAAITGTGSPGTATVSVTGVSCTQTAGLGTASCSGTAVINVTDGQVTLNGTPVTLSGTNASEFAVSAGSCSFATIAANSYCSLGTISFTPTAAGTRTVSLTPSLSVGTAGTAAVLNGTAVAPGSLTVTNSSGCSAVVNTTVMCPSSLTVTASGGTVQLGSSLTSVTGTNAADFSVDTSATGACAANQVLNSGSSCTLGVKFRPSAPGTRTATVAVSTSVGTGASGSVSGTGYNLTTSSASLSCGNQGAGVAGSDNCGSITVTANGAAITLGTPFVTFSDTHFVLGTTSCSNGQLLAAGASCSFAVSFSPAAVQGYTGTATISSNATTNVVSLSGSGAWGTSSVPTSASCGSVGAGQGSSTCQTVTVTAVNGPIRFGSSTFSSTNSAFSLVSDTCSSTTLAVGGTCSVGYSFAPTSVGNASSTITVTPQFGGASSFTLTGSGAAGALSVTGGDCGAATVGVRTNCAAITVSASGGPVVLASSLLTNTNSSEFSVTAGTCTAGGTLASGSSCSLSGAFTPSTLGTRTATVTVNASSGTSASFSLTGTGYSYSWQAGAWSAPSSSCSTAATETRSVGCVRNDSTPVADSFCTDPKPATSQTVSSLTGCTYGWQAGTFGTCSGGTGSWQYTSWTPATGCGQLNQTRTGTCVADANSGSASRSVSCVRSDGTSVDASACDAASMPAATQSCTPSTGFTCSTEDTLSRVTTDTTTCSYSWSTGAWSGTSNTCSGTATQTRSVSCLQSDGSTVADSLCSGAGAKPASSQTVADYSACTFSWQTSGFGSCSNGTGAWQYTSWAPAAGCGSFSQSRTGTCTAVANSGVQTQTVTCLRSDGTTVSDASCDTNSKPAVSQACTPTSGFSCGSEAALTQTGTDTSTCTYSWSVGNWSASSDTCSANATQTRSVSCTQSDGSTVADALCSGAKPATSQTVADYSSCTYGWQASGFSACTGGSGVWTYTSWTPASGCGTVSQSRSGACVANANSGNQTQTVRCLRSDGTAVSDASCDTNSKPAVSQACTPASGFSCGTEDALTQSVTLTNGCSYSWVGTSWSSCTGGTGTWQYTQWTPAAGLSCTTSLLQSRSATCAADTNTGSQTRQVTCQDQNGNVVDGSLCAGSPLPSTQSCTPTNGFSCGVQAALQQTVTDTSNCSYSWTLGNWSACTGGSGTWQYSAWTPTCGIGPTTQTRTGTCVANASSASQSRSVVCTRTDGTSVDPSLCGSTAPANIQSCTPTSGYSCGIEAALAQKVTLAKACTK